MYQYLHVLIYLQGAMASDEEGNLDEDLSTNIHRKLNVNLDE